MFFNRKFLSLFIYFLILSINYMLIIWLDVVDIKINKM